MRQVTIANQSNVTRWRWGVQSSQWLSVSLISAPGKSTAMSTPVEWCVVRLRSPIAVNSGSKRLTFINGNRPTSPFVNGAGSGRPAPNGDTTYGRIDRGLGKGQWHLTPQFGANGGSREFTNAGK